MASKSVQSDFDRLALLDKDEWSHNSHYYPYLLSQLPTPCGDSLEIGCGTGEFARRLTGRASHGLALDLLAKMIEVARLRSASCSNLEFLQADVLAWEFPPKRYDCIASIATLQHLPLAAMLEKMKAALNPRGVLLVLDLYQPEGLGHRLPGPIAFVASLTL